MENDHSSFVVDGSGVAARLNRSELDRKLNACKDRLEEIIDILNRSTLREIEQSYMGYFDELYDIEQFVIDSYPFIKEREHHKLDAAIVRMENMNEELDRLTVDEVHRRLKDYLLELAYLDKVLLESVTIPDDIVDE